MLVKEKMADSFLNFLGDCEKKKKMIGALTVRKKTICYINLRMNYKRSNNY